mmetsp:Transcript_14277/g.41633  ORF Transcript_14277/g.41633 Transcript_14277/m.41633 type:complete len:215 (-) Transcript_14277:173-817(-)|eukprot:352988-Chlamydomonas_euryale.AAC.4
MQPDSGIWRSSVVAFCHACGDRSCRGEGCCGSPACSAAWRWLAVLRIRLAVWQLKTTHNGRPACSGALVELCAALRNHCHGWPADCMPAAWRRALCSDVATQLLTTMCFGQSGAAACSASLAEGRGPTSQARCQQREYAQMALADLQQQYQHASVRVVDIWQPAEHLWGAGGAFMEQHTHSPCLCTAPEGERHSKMLSPPQWGSTCGSARADVT